MDKWLKRRDISDRLAWIEAIPYGETRGYVKNVARNMAIYSYLLAPQSAAKKNLSTSRIRRAVVKGLQKEHLLGKLTNSVYLIENIIVQIVN